MQECRALRYLRVGLRAFGLAYGLRCRALNPKPSERGWGVGYALVIIPLKQIEFEIEDGSGYIVNIRSPYTPYSFYLRGTIRNPRKESLLIVIQASTSEILWSTTIVVSCGLVEIPIPKPFGHDFLID